MKKYPLHRRMRFAWSGIASTLRSESSFRIQLVAAAGVFLLLLVLRPRAIWWAIVALAVAAVLAGELFNTSLELLMDHLHPDLHPAIARAKDCAAGAVLLLALASLAVAAALIWESR